MPTPRIRASLDIALNERELTRVLNQIQQRSRGTQLNINTTRAARNLTQVSNLTNRINRNLADSRRFGDQFGLSIGRSARAFAAYATATGVILKLTFAVKSAISESISLERQMIRLAQVVNQPVEKLNSLKSEIVDLAIETGISSNKLAEMTVVLGQAGIRGRDLSLAMKAIAKTDLSPTFQSIEKTAEGAVAILRQFKGSASDLEKQLGQINAVSKAFAVESDDLIEAVKRTGGVFAAAGGTFEEFISLFTSVRSTTRESAETIATGLRTIFTRLRRPETIEFLRQLNIEIADSAGNIKDPLAAITRISEQLKILGVNARSVQYSQLVEQLGGLRQVSKLIPLLKETAVAQEALRIAQSEGATSLEDDYRKAVQSTAKQMEILREEFRKIFIELSDNGQIREMVNLMIDMTRGAIRLADSLKELIPVLSIVAGLTVSRGIFRGFLGQNPRFSRLSGTPTGVFGLAGGGDTKHRNGGKVTGRDGTDNAGIYRLDRNEYVIKGKSANKIGTPALNHMNQYGEIPGMAGGGRVLPLSVLQKAISLIGLTPNSNVSKYINTFESVPNKDFLGRFLKESKALQISESYFGKRGFRHAFSHEFSHALDYGIRGFESTIAGSLNNTIVKSAPRNLKKLTLDRINLEKTSYKVKKDVAKRELFADLGSLSSSRYRILSGGSLDKENRIQLQQLESLSNVDLQYLDEIFPLIFSGFLRRNKGGSIDKVANMSYGEKLLAAGKKSKNPIDLLAGLLLIKMKKKSVKRNRGSLVPGGGPDRDSVLTALTPGEFVFSRKAVNNLGADNLAQLHSSARYNRGGLVGAGAGALALGLGSSLDLQSIFRDFAPYISEGIKVALGASFARSISNRGVGGGEGSRTSQAILARDIKGFLRDDVIGFGDVRQQNRLVVDSLRLFNSELRRGQTTAEARRRVEENINRELARTSAVRTGQLQTRGATLRESIGGFVGRARGVFNPEVRANALLGTSALATAGLLGAFSSLSSSFEDLSNEASKAGDAAQAYELKLKQLEAQTKQTGIGVGAATGGGIGAVLGGEQGAALGSLIGSALGATGLVTSIQDYIFGKDSGKENEKAAKEFSKEVKSLKISKDFQKVIDSASQIRLAARGGSEKQILDAERQSRRSLVSGTKALITGSTGLDGKNVGDLEKAREVLKGEIEAAIEPFITSGRSLSDFTKANRSLLATYSDLNNKLNINKDIIKTENDSLKERFRLGQQENKIRQQNLNILINSIRAQETFNRFVEKLDSIGEKFAVKTVQAKTSNEIISGNVSNASEGRFGTSLLELQNTQTKKYRAALAELSRISPLLKKEADDLQITSNNIENAKNDFLKIGNITDSGKRDEAISNIVKKYLGGADGAAEFAVKLKEAAKQLDPKQVTDLFESFKSEKLATSAENLELARVAIENNLNNLAQTLAEGAELEKKALDNRLGFLGKRKDLEQIFNPLDTFSKVTADRARTTTAILGRNSSFGEISAERVKLGKALQEVRAELEKGIRTEALVREEQTLVDRLNKLNLAYEKLTDTTDYLSVIQDKYAKSEERREKIVSTISSLTFGGSETRSNFRQNRALANFAYQGGNVQNLPEEMRASLLSFLQEFSDINVFGGLTGSELINKVNASTLAASGFSQQQINSILEKQIPIEVKQLEALLAIQENTAEKEIADLKVTPMAKGGKVKKGPGIPASDSVLAMLTPGEVVLPRRAVRNISQNVFLPKQLEAMFDQGIGLDDKSLLKRAKYIAGKSSSDSLFRKSISTDGKLDASKFREYLQISKDLVTNEYAEVVKAFGYENGTFSDGIFSSVITRGRTFLKGKLNKNPMIKEIASSSLSGVDKFLGLKDGTAPKELLDAMLGYEFFNSMKNLKLELERAKQVKFANSGDVTRTGLALVHKGESVVRPAQKSNAGSYFNYEQKPEWVNTFAESVRTLSNTSIKIELAPTQITTRIVGAELLATLDDKVKKIVYEELANAVSRIQHSDNRGTHALR